jgi:hypothetical protein
MGPQADRCGRPKKKTKAGPARNPGGARFLAHCLEFFLLPQMFIRKRWLCRSAVRTLAAEFDGKQATGTPTPRCVNGSCARFQGALQCSKRFTP